MKNILPKRPLNKDYDLVIRGAPFGGHNNGKDDDGEFYHKATQLSSHPVPIMYAHGNQLPSQESLKGQIYGVTEDIWAEADGFYYGVQIFEDAEIEDAQGVKHKAKQFFRDSANQELLFASLGSLAGAELKIDKATGSIDKMTTAELSLIDKRITPNLAPRNHYAVARTKAYQNFIKAGIIADNLQIKGLCKCGCEVDSESLRSDDLLLSKAVDVDTDTVTKKCEACTDTKKCLKCQAVTGQTNKPKGENMSLIATLKALMAGKQDGEELTVEEVTNVLKAGETTQVVTSSNNIADIVSQAVISATKPLTDKIASMETNFQTQLTVLKATQEQNSFNKYLSSMLNTKLTSAEVAQYTAIYGSLDGIDSTVKESTITALKAQIEAKTPLADLMRNGFNVLDEQTNQDTTTQADETAYVASVALKAGQEVFGQNKEAKTALEAIAKKALEATNGGAK